jgi:hypothetical protein
MDMWLCGRGRVRQEHWANAPQLPPEEPVEAKGGKGKAGAKKKVRHITAVYKYNYIEIFRCT